MENQEQWSQAITRAKQSLEIIARKSGTDVDTIRKRIQNDIIRAMTDPSSEALGEWAKIPKTSEYPMPEEVIAYYFTQFS